MLQEFCKIYRQFFPFGDATNFASFMFGMFDCDQNGLVSFREFVIALSVTSQGSLEDKLQCKEAVGSPNKERFDKGGVFLSRSKMISNITFGSCRKMSLNYLIRNPYIRGATGLIPRPSSLK